MKPDRGRFVADVMLGRLARWLRALGCDTLYFREAADARLLGLALRERRCLLTRDLGLARRAGPAGLLVRGDDLDQQLRQVVDAQGLVVVGLRSRCLECNGQLVPCRPEEVCDRVPPYTLRTQRRFWSCAGCGRVFWPGSHAAGILSRLRPYLIEPLNLLPDHPGAGDGDLPPSAIGASRSAPPPAEAERLASGFPEGS